MERKDKKDFKLYIDSLVCVDEMTNDEAGELLKAFIAFWREEPFEIKSGVKFAYKIFEAQFQRDFQAWDEACCKNAQNGKKGGRPKTEENPKNPVGFSETQKTQTNPKKGDTDTDTEKGTETEKEKWEREIPPFSEKKEKFRGKETLSQGDEMLLNDFISEYRKISEINPAKINFLQNAFLGLSAEEKISLSDFLGDEAEREENGRKTFLQKYKEETENGKFAKKAENFLAEKIWEKLKKDFSPPPRQKFKSGSVSADFGD